MAMLSDLEYQVCMIFSNNGVKMLWWKSDGIWLKFSTSSAFLLCCFLYKHLIFIRIVHVYDLRSQLVIEIIC